MIGKAAGGGGGGSKKKEDGVFELEEQFILRVLPNVARELRQDLKSGAQNLKDKLMIDLNPERRRGKVIYNGQIFSAKLVDLPCIIESLKTTDQKTFYKTANISQMLVCGSDDDDDDDDAREDVVMDLKKKKDKDKKYQWPHGICPPLKNVRNRRFRKPMPRKNPEQPDIDKEVRKLFEQDHQAVNVSYEIAYEETNQLLSKDGMLEDSTMQEEETVNEDNKTLQFGEIFGEVSSSDDDDQDVNVMDSADEGPSSSVMPADAGMVVMDDYMLGDMCSSDMPDLQSKLHEVSQQLNDLRDRRMAIENDLAIAEGATERNLLEAELQNIVEEESTKEKELVILKSTLSST